LFVEIDRAVPIQNFEDAFVLQFFCTHRHHDTASP
jgi:hypothetical protein